MSSGLFEVTNPEFLKKKKKKKPKGKNENFVQDSNLVNIQTSYLLNTSIATIATMTCLVGEIKLLKNSLAYQRRKQKCMI